LREHKGEIHRSQLGDIEQAVRRGKMALVNRVSDPSKMVQLNNYLESLFDIHRTKLQIPE
jgi:hypothetical protein